MQPEHLNVLRNGVRPYVCVVTYESGNIEVKELGLLEEVAALKAAARSGLSAVLTVDVFIRMPS